MEERSKTHVTLNIKANANFSTKLYGIRTRAFGEWFLEWALRRYATNVVIKIPTPHNTARVNIVVGAPRGGGGGG